MDNGKKLSLFAAVPILLVVAYSSGGNVLLAQEEPLPFTTPEQGAQNSTSVRMTLLGLDDEEGNLIYWLAVPSVGTIVTDSIPAADLKGPSNNATELNLELEGTPNIKNQVVEGCVMDSLEKIVYCDNAVQTGRSGPSTMEILMNDDNVLQIKAEP